MNFIGAMPLVGIRLSWETMEYAPWISPWLSCSACCDCTVQFWSGRPCCSYCRCKQPLASWMLMPSSAIYTVSSTPTVPLSSACLFGCCLNGESPAAAICSCGFPVCWVDVACLHISFTDIFVPENRPSSRSGSSSQLAIQYVLGDSAILHAPDMT